MVATGVVDTAEDSEVETAEVETPEVETEAVDSVVIEEETKVVPVVVPEGVAEGT